MMKSWVGFGDLDLIFRVTVGLKEPNLSQWGNELNKQDAFVQILHKLLCVDRYFHVSVFCVFVWKRNKCFNQIGAKRCLCAQYLMNQLLDFDHICMDITFGHNEKLNRFWWPCPIFKVTARLNPPNFSQKVFVHMLSHVLLLDGMLPNSQAYINWTESIAYSILVPLTQFSRSQLHDWKCHDRRVWEVGDICFLWKHCYISQVGLGRVPKVWVK